MPGSIVNPSTGQAVLEASLCVPIGAAFDLDTLKGQFEGEIAAYDATLCPEAVSLDEAAFTAKYSGKIVLWVNNLPNACYNYFDVAPWYARLVAAGAVGVVNLQNFGQTPGVWHTTFTGATLRANGFLKAPPIPVVSCEVTSADTYAAIVSNQQIMKLVDRSYPFNLSTLSGTFNVDENPWKATVFNNTLYRFVFQGFIAGLFFLGAGLGVYYMYERVQSVRKHNKGSLGKVMSVPFVALALEVTCCFILGLFFVVDGNWAVEDSAMSSLRQSFLGQLALISMGSSVLIGLSFTDFRQSSKRLRNLTQSSFASRHRTFLLGSAMVLVLFEIVAGVMRGYAAFVWLALNALSILIAGLIGVWFAFEAKQFTEILEELSNRAGTFTATTASSNNGGVGSMLRRVVIHTRYWTIASSAVLFFMVIMNLSLNFGDFLWQPDYWPILWFFTLTGRATFSIFKVILCRLPTTQREGKRQSTYGSTTNGTAGVGTYGVTSHAVVGMQSMNHMPKGQPMTITDDDRSTMSGGRTGSYASNVDSKMRTTDTGEVKGETSRPPTKLTIASESELDGYI
jgi:hypothetical protein